MKIISSSDQETEDIAAKFAKGLHPGSVLALYGELGAGKTVFARGLAKALGVEEYVQSPTFVIANEYKIQSPRIHGVEMFFHLDLYRIEDPESAYVFGIDEYLAPHSAITLIEWAEKIEAHLPKKIIKMHLVHLDENHREIRIIIPAGIELSHNLFTEKN